MIKYKIIDDSAGNLIDSEQVLNELGKENWELCAALETRLGAHRLYFKRVVKEDNANMTYNDISLKNS